MKTPIIVLHGWGLKGSVYKNLSVILQNKGYKVFSPDMPGFGTEPLLKTSMDLDDYVFFVKKFVEKNKIDKPILIGHSFGGRVSIKFAYKFPQNLRAIVLTGSPGVREKMSLFRRLVQYVAVSMGKMFRIDALSPVKKILRKGLYFMIGEWDYYKAGDLRETFKKVIAENLVTFLPKIKVPTLIVWGENDKVVPQRVGEAISRNIPNSNLVIIKNVGHKLPYEKPKAFINAMLPFLEKV